MNKNKQAYDRPTTDILVVRFESALLTGSPVVGVNGLQNSNAIDGTSVGFDGWDDE